MMLGVELPHPLQELDTIFVTGDLSSNQYPITFNTN